MTSSHQSTICKEYVQQHQQDDHNPADLLDPDKEHRHLHRACFQDASRSSRARWLLQSVIATTEASASEFASKILPAAVSLKPQSSGTSHEVEANTASILPWVSNEKTGFAPKR